MAEELNEGVDYKLRRIDKESEKLYEEFRDQMDLLEKSPLAKVRGGLTSMDVFTLGRQLRAFDEYKSMCEDEGSMNQLGKIPLIAHDVITVGYGTSVLPIIASVQPIEEEQGVVYFKNVKAMSTRGNATAFDSLTNIDSGKAKTLSGYSGATIDQEQIGAAGDGTTKTWNATLAAKPVRNGSFSVYLESSATTIKGIDDGLGNILGLGLSGTINYITGAVQINFFTAPASTKRIYASYQTNYEISTDIPELTSFWDTKQIFAKVYALKGSIGMLQSYGMKKRFGLVAEDELANDLVGEMNSEMGGDLVKKMVAAAQGNVNWSRTPATGISDYEHRLSFKFSLANAEKTLSANAGRGLISVYVGGKDFCEIISTQAGFTKLTDGTTIGIHVYGTIDGIPVIRVLDANVLAAGVGLCIYKGQSPFEAPAVYTPFMPLVVTSTLPNGVNPLRSQRAAAVWAGIDVLVGNFITMVTVTA